MSKAYDRVKWIWLEKIVNRLGFDEKWRNLVMQCVTTVTYSVRINGKPKGHIIPTRGIRQGNPLSPYLFLLCAEGLSSLIKKVVDDGVMEGLVIYQRRGGGGARLSPLFFANDSLIFCKALIEECNSLQRILTIYEEASGQ